MEDLTDIKRIWTDMPDRRVPDFRQISRAVKSYRMQTMINTAGLIMLMLVLALTMVWVIVDYNSQLLSTRIGEGLMISAIIIMLSHTVKAMRHLTSATNLSNDDFLRFLKKEQVGLFQFQKRTQRIGFLIASVGLLLYLYEGVRTATATLLTAYSLVLIWIAVAWFIVRPRVVKRKMARLDERIRDLERISEQIKGH